MKASAYTENPAKLRNTAPSVMARWRDRSACSWILVSLPRARRPSRTNAADAVSSASVCSWVRVSTSRFTIRSMARLTSRLTMSAPTRITATFNGRSISQSTSEANPSLPVEFQIHSQV